MAQINQRRQVRQKRKKMRFRIFSILVIIVSILGYFNYDGLQIGYNKTLKIRTKSKIKYIVIHDTANTAIGANVYNHYIYFNSANRKSSADFFVDDNEVLQVNNYYKYYTWHCGDGGADAKINNQNSIGVEICVNQDGDYEKAVNNAINLTKKLMKELDVSVENVVRHKDASGKDCPQSMSENDWLSFKNLIT